MTEVLCTAITAAATVLCAYIAHKTGQREKREDERAEQRAKEGRLQLKMSEANNKLTIGVAMALKTGHANGEIEAGLKAVEDAQNDYRLFLEGLALDELKK